MKNKFLTNTSWLLVGQVVRMVISVVIGMLTARYLGPSNYGTINYVNSYIIFFTSLVGLGLNSVIIYEFVNHKEEEGKILGTAIFMRLVVGILSSVAFLVLIYLTDGSDKIVFTVAVLQAIQLPFLAFDTINFWYQSKLLSKYSVIVQTIAYIITSLYKVYLLLTAKPVEWFAMAISIDVILLAGMYVIAYQRHRKQPFRLSFQTGKRLLKGCGFFILANMMVVIYGQMDKIMIKQMLNSTEAVGLYSAAIVICGIIGFIPTAILDSARPMIMDAKKQDEQTYQLRIRQLFAGVIWICFLYSIGITIFSKLAIYILYGNTYLSANICLKIAVWYTAFSYLGSAKNLWLICEGKNKYVFIFSAMGAFTNLILNFIMIPMWGINGAAVATLATQILSNFLYPVLFLKTKGYLSCVLDAMLLRNINIKELYNSLAIHKRKP